MCYILPLHLFRIRASFDYVLDSVPVPLRFYSGSAPVLLRFHSGLPLRFRSGSTPVPLRFHSGSTPVLLRFCSGSTPVPLRFRSGSTPVLLRFCSGSAPVPLRSCSLYKEGLFLITFYFPKLRSVDVSDYNGVVFGCRWKPRVSGRMNGSILG